MLTINDDRLSPVGKPAPNPAVDLSSDTIVMKFVYKKTVVDFIKRLAKIHNKYVNLLSSSRLDAKSSMNSKNWVSHDLALLRPCCMGYRILLSSPWFMMVLQLYAPLFCSRHWRVILARSSLLGNAGPF